ncbi:GNAT family N-acetyltransferase [Actinomadura decatromicini]|uniref:GNAT family N-acetyltransferase n=1 Tax=Actinomadura decatromicini TaxID=2604572 RepID=A0A5D3FYY6_9ACTN|nr:GNAT family N-acetyltransferase [Actinomadura decatromicini]TYK52395.1 GNAT family N-acetyltransferase [Actinomadura decatromicini]
MKAEPLSLTTRELTTQTWPDFETLFSQGNGWDFCWCMAFQRDKPLPGSLHRTRAERSVVNHRDKRELVCQGRSHGVLVYDGGAPIGWCQYGRKDELPLMDGRRGRFAKPPLDGVPAEDWRVTCFVVAKKYRRRGVAATALRAVLAAIGDAGGGLVEGYPLDLATKDRWGPGTWSDYGHFGTVSMFEAEGFTRVGMLRPTNAIMHKDV